MAVPPAPDQRSGVVNSPDNTHPSQPSPVRRGAALGLMAVAVLCALVIAFVFVTRTDAPGRSAGDRVQALAQGDGDAEAARKEVLALAQQFMLRVNTYGPADLDESDQMAAYRDRVSSIITPKFKASFEQGVEAAEQSVAQAGVGRTSQVFGAGVSSIDVDSARVLVGGSFTVSYPNSDAEGAERVAVEPSPFRVEVTLVKVEGVWLVDDFTPITGLPANESPLVPQDGATDPAAPESSDPAPSDPAPSEAAPTEGAPTERDPGGPTGPQTNEGDGQ